MVKYQHRDNSICIIKSDAGKEWRMMKKVDKKKIILSVLLSSMLWSNSLYAYELKGDESGKVDPSVKKLFEVITIAGIQPDEILQLKNNEELTINGVILKDDAFNNVSEVKNSTLNTVYGGLNDSGNDNKISITNSMLSAVAGGLGIANDANANHVIIVNSNVGQAFGGTSLNGNSNNNVVKVIYDKNTYNTTYDTKNQVFGGYATVSSSRDKITANQNTVIINGNNKKLSSGIGIKVAQILSMGGTATKLEANNNSAYIKNFGNEDNIASTGNVIGGTITSQLTDSAESVTWDSSKNLVNIENSYLKIDNEKIGVVGAAIESGWKNNFAGTATANENIVNIRDSLIFITNTDVGIAGGYVSEASDGKFTGLTSADNNIVNIDNSTITGLISGGRNDKGQVIDNHIIINNKSVIEGDVIGGYTGGYAAVGNTIEISGNNTLDKANLYGYKGINSTPTITSDNSLKVEDFNGKINSVNNFEKLEYSNIEWKNDGTVIEAEKTKNLINAEVIVSGKNGFKLNSGNLNVGESMTLLHSGNRLGNIKDLENGKEFNTIVGVATAVDGIIEQPDENNITATIKDVKLADQTNLVASNRAVAAAFVNQGTDLIADSLDTLSRDGKYGVKTFAAVHGNRSKYDVNSDIKINGWSTIVGVGAENEHNGGDFSWGVFYENGSGNYRTYNDFNNEFFRGDGSLVYNGGGIAARYENSHGVYTEGSLRAGMLKSEMTDALSDGENKYGYESETAYYGAHIGVGKIFSLGDDSDLDVYGKFFHTYTEGDSFNVAGDEFEFDSINSDRLRIGARVTSNKENKFSTYYGLAYEYEFNGDAEMRAAGMKAPTQSLQGSSVMAEIGLNYQPTPDSPWSFDLNMRGYAGERQGGSFNVQATYTF